MHDVILKFSNKHIGLVLVIVCAVLYLLFAYWLERHEFIILLLLYGGLFFCSWKIIEHTKFNFWVLAGIGVLLRLLFLPALPNLSQDFFRFLWDGRLSIQGVNPYSLTPQLFFTDLSAALEASGGVQVAQASELYAGMGTLNASHYSNYPPINQLCFAIAALFAGKSILGSAIVLRVLIIAADIGILYFGKKLLSLLKLPVKNIFWYFLNPFILIELTGNLHFEGVMLLFVVWALYVLQSGKWVWAALLWGLSISVKLLPMLLLPLFLKWFYRKERSRGKYLTTLIGFYVIVLSTVLVTFAPFLSSEFFANFSATILLWFQNFEFNASIYYIIRWIGFQTVGWNIIGTVGKILPLITILVLLVLSVFRKYKHTRQLITGMLFGISVYFLLSTTVHPWYVATPLLLCLFTRYKFPVVWSAVVMLSYAAYGATGFDENLWLVGVEYLLVGAFAITEIMSKSGPKRGNFRIIEG